jgi:copper(I)-binding protein
MTRSRFTSGRAAALVGVLAVTLALSGCGMGEEAQTPQEVRITPGTGGRVGSVAVRDAKIVFSGPIPDGVVYRPGDDAPLQLTVVNDGTAPDALVAVRSPIAGSGSVVGDATMPGGHGLVAGYDHPVAATTLPRQSEVDVTLVDVTTPIRSGLTYPVTFVFARAGELSMTLPVEVPADVPVPRADPPPAGPSVAPDPPR